MGDKSNAEKVKRRFEMSEENYKKAIGDSHRRHPISIKSDDVYLQRARK